MTQVGRPPHRLVGVLRSAHGHLEGVLLSGEQTDADVGAGLPSPIGEEPAVVEEVSSLQAWVYSGGNPARPAYKGLTKGSRGFPDSPGKFLCWHAGLP
jgi:hypothetical protein